MKIISLVPSITELIFDLGLKHQLIGRTKFCIHPADAVKQIPQFGGTKSLHLDKIKAAKPDLIIANKEENLKSEIEFLMQDFDVLLTDVVTLEDNNAMILDIGQRTQSLAKAEEIVQEINNNFNSISPILFPHSVLYLIWKDPIMAAGKNTFIDEMLQKAGFENAISQMERYPEIDKNMELFPEFIFLSSEPYPFSDKHFDEINSRFPQSKCVLVDGEMFSWYGSRMRYAPEYFLNLRRNIEYAD